MRQSTPWYLSSHGNFLGVLSSSFAIFKYTRLSPTRNYPGAVTALFVDTLNIEILIVVDKSTYLLLSQEPIQVLSGVMRSCMFSFSGRSVDPTVYIIYFLLVIATLLGVSQRGGSSSLLYPAKTGTIGCPPILFIFTKVYFNTLDICFHQLLSHARYGNLLEGSAPILRVLFSLLYLTFSEKSLKW